MAMLIIEKFSLSTRFSECSCGAIEKTLVCLKPIKLKPLHRATQNDAEAPGRLWFIAGREVL